MTPEERATQIILYHDEFGMAFQTHPEKHSSNRWSDEHDPILTPEVWSITRCMCIKSRKFAEEVRSEIAMHIREAVEEDRLSRCST